MANIKQQRIKVSICAYAYEEHNDSLISDHDYDMLSNQVYERRYQSTDDKVMDQFYALKFSKDTGMWIYDHPDYSNGKLELLYQRYKVLQCQRTSLLVQLKRYNI